MVRWGHGKRATSIILRWMLGSLRVLVLLFAVQASGAVHIVEDIVGECVAQPEPSSDCPDDPADCPPGCPNCHGHWIAGLPRHRDEVGGGLALEETPLPFAFVDVTRPSSPDIAGPFRPPQSA